MTHLNLKPGSYVPIEVDLSMRRFDFARIGICSALDAEFSGHAIDAPLLSAVESRACQYALELLLEARLPRLSTFQGIPRLSITHAGSRLYVRPVFPPGTPEGERRDWDDAFRGGPLPEGMVEL